MGCPEVAADDVRLALAAAQEAPGLVGEAVDVGLQPGSDDLAPVHRIPVGDDVGHDVDRSPHWSTHAIATPSAFAASITG